MGHLAYMQTYCVLLWQQDVCFWNQQRTYLYVCSLDYNTSLLTSKETDLSSFLGDVLNLSFGTNVMRKKKSVRSIHHYYWTRPQQALQCGYCFQSIEQLFPFWQRPLFPGIPQAEGKEKWWFSLQATAAHSQQTPLILGTWQRSLFFSSAEYLGKEASPSKE